MKFYAFSACARSCRINLFTTAIDLNGGAQLRRVRAMAEGDEKHWLKNGTDRGASTSRQMKNRRFHQLGGKRMTKYARNIGVVAGGVLAVLMTTCVALPAADAAPGRAMRTATWTP